MSGSAAVSSRAPSVTGRKSRRPTARCPAAGSSGVSTSPDVPPGQAKYVTCVSGAILDVIVDLRVGSPSFAALGGRPARRRRTGARCSSPKGSGTRSWPCSDRGHGHLPLLHRRTRPRASTACTRSTRTSPSPGPSDVEPILSDKDAAAPSLAQARRDGLLPGYADCRAYAAQLRGSLHGPLTVRSRNIPGAAAGRGGHGRQPGQAALQSRPPVADRREPGPAPRRRGRARCRRAAAPAGAARCSWIGRTRAGSAPSSRKTSRASPNQVVSPAARRVVDAGRRARASRATICPATSIGPGGLAALVVHHVDRWPPAFQPDHRADEVRPVRPVQPGRSAPRSRPGQAVRARPAPRPAWCARRRCAAPGARPPAYGCAASPANT